MTSLAADFARDLPGISPDVYGERDFRAIAAIVEDEAGIVLPAGKAMLVYSRIAPLVRAAGAATFAAYVERVKADPAECRKTISALTTNHTFFYREAHHFEHLAAVNRPGLLRQLDGGQPVRLWSAGCSSGEETWSLVMTLLGPDKTEGRRMAQKNLRVLASDIDENVLRKASAATYGTGDLKAVPGDLRQAWTETTGEQSRMNDVARSIVRFRMLNLMTDWPMRKPFDTIFCRNVMIYFDQPTKERLVHRFAQQLKPGGFLYIGHSERATGPAAALLDAVGPTIYRRRP